MIFLGIGAVWMIGAPTSAATTYSGSLTLAVRDTGSPTSVLLYSYVANETAAISELVANDLGQDYFDEGEATTAEIVADRASAFAEPEIGTITLAVVGMDSQAQVGQTIDAFARHITEYGRQRRIDERDSSLATLAARERLLVREVGDMQERLDFITGLQPESQVERGIPADRILETTISARLGALNIVLADIEALDALTDAELNPLEVVGSATIKEQPGPADPLGYRGRLAVAVALASLLGIGLSLGLHRFDPKLYDRRDTENALRLPVLVEIPELPRKLRRTRKPVLIDQPSHPAAEAFRQLRSAVSRLTGPATKSGRARDEGSVLLVVSPSEGTGKSTTAVNLAVAAAEAGINTLLVSADLRKPMLHKSFDVVVGAGLSDAIAQPDALHLDHYTQPSGIDRLDLLLHGTGRTNPGELLGRCGKLFEDARADYTLVIVDSPPMLIGNDVTELSRFVDSVLVVTRAGRTTIDESRWLDETTQRLNMATVGAVLVGSTPEIARSRSLRRYGEATISQRIRGRIKRMIRPPVPDLAEAMALSVEDDEVDSDTASTAELPELDRDDEFAASPR